MVLRTAQNPQASAREATEILALSANGPTSPAALPQLPAVKSHSHLTLVHRSYGTEAEPPPSQVGCFMITICATQVFGLAFVRSPTEDAVVSFIFHYAVVDGVVLRRFRLQVELG